MKGTRNQAPNASPRFPVCAIAHSEFRVAVFLYSMYFFKCPSAIFCCPLSIVDFQRLKGDHQVFLDFQPQNVKGHIQEMDGNDGYAESTST